MQFRTLSKLLGVAENDFRRAFQDKLLLHRVAAADPDAAQALLSF